MCLSLRFVHVLLELDLEGVVKRINLLDQVHLHGLCLFDVLVTCLLLLSKEVVLDLTQLVLLLLNDRLDHLAQFLGLGVVSARNIALLPVVLLRQDAHVTVELFVEAAHARILQVN